VPNRRKRARLVTANPAVREVPSFWLTGIQRAGEKLQGVGKSIGKLVAVFGVVALWLAYGPFGIYSPIGTLDPWFYTGYFTNFSYLLLHHGITYYVSRLPWIVPGRIAFSVASPEVATLLLCAAIVTASGLSLYFVVRWYYGHFPAILAALALITNTYFMSAVCWQYPDGAAIAYAMIGLAFYLRPHGNPQWNGCLAAGALTLSGFAQMAGAPVILSLLVIPLLRWRHSPKELLRQGLCMLAGVGATTLLLMAVSRSMLGDARVFKPQLDMWISELHHPNYLSDMWGTGLGFLLRASRLFTPAFLLVLAPVILIAARKPTAIAWACYFAFLTCCLSYMFQEFVIHRVSLRVPFVSSYLLVLVFCAVGVVLGELWNHKEASPVVRDVAATALAILTLALPFVYGVWRSEGVHELSEPIWRMLSSIGAVTIVLAILGRRQRLPLQYVTSALVLIAISAGPAMDLNIGAGLGQQKILHASNLFNGPNAEVFLCLMKIQNYIKSEVDDPRWDLIFWWDEDEPQSALFKSAESLYLSGRRDITKELSSGSGRLYPTNTMMVHLTSHPERIGERTKLMASRGIGVAYERHTDMTYDRTNFTVALQDLKLLTASADLQEMCRAIHELGYTEFSMTIADRDLARQ
jgi:hypothetical protein